MRLLLALLLFACAGTALAQSDAEPGAEADATIRTYLEPEGDIHVGQLVRLWVEISTATWFTQAPRYPELQVEGAIALLPEQLGVNFSTTERGETRTGQRQRFVIIPQRAGTLAIPSLTVKLRVSVDGRPSEPITLTTNPTDLTAILPPGAERLGQIITIKELSVDERYDRGFDDLKVGDAITRTVTLRGENTFALALPKTEFVQVAGTRVYPAQAKLEDSVNRGQYRAVRTDAAVYVLEREGSVTLPEIAVRWWNPEAGRVGEEILPEASFAVAANPNYRAPAVGGGREALSQRVEDYVTGTLIWLRANIAGITLAAVGLYLGVLAWRRFGLPLLGRWQAFRERRRHSEARYFRDFRRACNSGDEGQIVRTFWHWLDRLTPENRVASLARLARTSGDQALLPVARALGQHRYGNAEATAPTGEKIKQHATGFRNQLLGHDKSRLPAGRSLNPRAAGNGG